MSKRKKADKTIVSAGANNPPHVAVGAGGGGVSVGVVAPLPVVPIPASVPALVPPPAGGGAVAGVAVTYAVGVRMRILQHTNLIRDLAEIVLSYSAFCGEECISVDGHNVMVNCVAVFPNGNYCSGSYDKSIKVWNLDGNCLQTLQGNNVIYQTKIIATVYIFILVYKLIFCIFNLILVKSIKFLIVYECQFFVSFFFFKQVI